MPMGTTVSPTEVDDHYPCEQGRVKGLSLITYFLAVSAVAAPAEDLGYLYKNKTFKRNKSRIASVHFPAGKTIAEYYAIEPRVLGKLTQAYPATETNQGPAHCGHYHRAYEITWF